MLLHGVIRARGLRDRPIGLPNPQSGLPNRQSVPRTTTSPRSAQRVLFGASMKHRLFLCAALVACSAEPITPSSAPDTGTEQPVRQRGPLRDVVYHRYDGVDPALTSLDVHFGPSVNAPAVVFVHGGGWRSGDKTNIEATDVISILRDHGYALVSINMRLVGNAGSPGTTPRDQTEDVARALRWVFDNAERIGIDENEVSLLGYSSGAHLVALAGTDDSYLNAVGLTRNDLFAVLPFDVVAYDIPRAIAEACAHDHCTSERALPAIFGNDPAGQRELSPLTYVNAPESYPPFFIVSAGKKDRSPQTLSLAQSTYLQNGLRAAGGIAALHHEADLDHTQLIGELGTPGTALSDAVLAFLAAPSNGDEIDDCAAMATAFREAFEAQTANLAPFGGVVAAVDTMCGTWRAAAGRADETTTMTPDHLVRIGSVTKTYTAGIVLRMAAQGTLSLDQRLANWFPSFPNARDITIRMMLEHSSGIANLTDDRAFMMEVLRDPTRVWTPADLIAEAAVLQPNFAPGTSRAYSNTNYILLGAIVEAVTGVTYGDVLDNRILATHELGDTILEDGRPLARLARGYDSSGEDITDIIHPTVRWAAGAIAATATDVAKWGRFHYGSDVPDVDLGATVQELPGVGTVYGHGGSAPGFSSRLMYSLEKDRSVAVTCTNDRTLADRLATALLEK